MEQEILSISLPLPLRMGDVNCYLVKNSNGFFLVDTGGRNNRTQLERDLRSVGCQPGNLKLIIITHGDFDHTGNAAYFRDKYNVKITMHRDDAGMTEHGDIFSNRKQPNILVRLLIKVITPIFFRFGRSERFTPDVYLEDGDDLSEYGLDAKVIHIPGHSKGSIGILTPDGNLIGGDLILKPEKSDQPQLNSIIDDLEVARTSINKLKSLNIKTVYPGHSTSFDFNTLAL